jgi:4-amino-4-deoxy-L-arabinose transferase-like glycosyltransferase
MEHITQCIKQFRPNKYWWLLAGIIVLAAFLRLYRISDYMTFLGDEGRDLIEVKKILSGNLVFLGPRSSAADFYYGPVYFYLITPFLWLFRYDPVGPAVFIALLGVATVYLVYLAGT